MSVQTYSFRVLMALPFLVGSRCTLDVLQAKEMSVCAGKYGLGSSQ